MLKNIISNVLFTIVSSFIVAYFTFPYIEQHYLQNKAKEEPSTVKFIKGLSLSSSEDKENETLILMAKSYCESQNRELVDVRTHPAHSEKQFMCSTKPNENGFWLGKNDIILKYKFVSASK